MKRDKLYFLFGLVTPLMPWLSPDLLTFLAVFLLLIEFSRIKLEYIKPLLPYLLLTFSFVAVQLLYVLSYKFMSWQMLNVRDFKHLMDFAAEEAHYTLHPLYVWVCLIVCFGIAAIVNSTNNFSNLFWNGVQIGTLVAVIITALQILAISVGLDIAWLFPNQTQYWSSLDRVVGTFSDPNALGIFTILVLPIFIDRIKSATDSKARMLSGVVTILSCLVALYCGSRSFVLGLLVLLFCALYRRNRYWLGLAALVGVIILAIINTLDLSFVYPVLPQSLERTFKSLQYVHLNETFFSRSVFLQVNLQILAHFPFFGIGLGSFSQYVAPISADLGLGTAIWSDNTNNFYLGILSETGVVGALLLFIGCVQYKCNRDVPAYVTQAIIILAGLFLTGPHLEHIEVAIISGALFGLSFSLDSRRNYFNSTYVAALIGIVFLIIRGHFGEVGWYIWEQDHLRYFRWAQPVATTKFKCDASNNTIAFDIRAFNPDIKNNPLGVKITTNEQQQEFTVKNSDPVSVKLFCTNESVPVTIECSRGWSPRNYRRAADPRLLGVQVLLDSPGQIATN